MKLTLEQFERAKPLSTPMDLSQDSLDYVKDLIMKRFSGGFYTWSLNVSRFQFTLAMKIVPSNEWGNIHLNLDLEPFEWFVDAVLINSERPLDNILIYSTGAY